MKSLIGDPSCIYLDEPTSGMVRIFNVKSILILILIMMNIGCWCTTSTMEYGDKS
jgi:ABC-type Na+ transport system ATPase subunit NatA